ncbi:unnamed protein product [Paramecium octaurelia]|uniref:Uncharacterized protein n=1 Tax=Paramecium octaurelia TaxID=43137 RepID=A0A8S1YM61_PAROT|nr:unnamed protein product [Paramecium octaurelia]
MLGMASRLISASRPLTWMQYPQLHLYANLLSMGFAKPILPDTSILTISTFRRKPAKLKKAKRKQRRKKIKRMNKANRERRNY